MRASYSNSPRRQLIKFDPSVGQSPNSNRNQIHNYNDRVRQRAKVADIERAKQRKFDRLKKIESLDSLVEVHLMMKSYSEKLKIHLTPYNSFTILNKIFSQLTAQTGKLSLYFDFLQKELVKFIITEDEKILDCISKIFEIKQEDQLLEQIKATRILTYSEACEIFRLQVEKQITQQACDLKLYKEELQQLKQQIVFERLNQIQEIEKIRLEVSQQRNSKDTVEGQLQSKIKLLEQEIQQLIWQIQEIKDVSFRTKEKLEQEKSALIQDFQITNREQNIMIFDLRSQITEMKEQIIRLTQSRDDFKQKFMDSYGALKNVSGRVRNLEAEKSQLISDRSIQAVRSATAFDDLTPRPDLGQIEQYLKIDFRSISGRSTIDKLSIIQDSVYRQMERQRQEIVQLKEIQEEQRSKLKQKEKRQTEGQESRFSLQRQKTKEESFL